MAGNSALLAGVASSLLFVSLNVAMNLYMKWLFAPYGGNFALPWTMLAVQQFETYVVLQPWLAYRDTDNCWGWGMGSNVVEEERIGFSALLQVLAVTVLFCLNVGLNSLSLVRITITLNQTVRAFLPVGILLLATLLEQRTYPGHSYVTTALLVIGIALTCWGSPDFELYGFSLALASTLVAALGTSLNGRLLSSGPFSKGTPGKDKIMRLMMLQSVPAFFLFGAVAFWTEAEQLREMLEELGLVGCHQKFGLVSLSSVLALMSNVGRLFLVAATSALMETLAGNAKVAALCIIDNRLFGTALTGCNYAGIVLTFVGFSVHLLLQYATREEDSKAEEEEDEEKEEDKCADDFPPVDADLRRDSLHVRFAEDAEGGTSRTSIGGGGTSRTSIGGRRVSTSSRRGSITDSGGLGAMVRAMNRPRLISAADTGLASEHLALDYGRQKSSQPKRPSIHAAPVLRPDLSRPRSKTWQAGAPSASPKSLTWLNNMHLDLASVIEAPQWLSTPSHSRTGSMGGSTESEVSDHGYQQMPLSDAGLSPVQPSRSRCQTEPAPAFMSRSRLLTDVPPVVSECKDHEEMDARKAAEEAEMELERAVVEDLPPVELAPL